MADLIVRVQTPDYETWLHAFTGAANGLLASGINGWTIYRDSWNHNNVMVHFVAEDIDRAMAFFKSEDFKQINAASGATDRTFFIGQQPGTAAKPAAKRATKAAGSTAAKSAAKGTAAKAASTEKAPAKPRTRTTKKQS